MRGRYADRPTTISAMGQRQHSRRNARSGPAARPTRAIVEIPRIASRAVGQIFRSVDDAELGHIGHADQHEAGSFERLEEWRRLLRDIVPERTRSSCQAHASYRGVVLDEDRNPREGTG